MRYLITMALLFTLAACGGDSTGPDSYESVGGLWVGTIVDGQYTRGIAFQIVDTDGSLTGNMRLAGENENVPFVGTREGSAIQLALTIYTYTVQYTVQVVATIINEDQIVGTFTVSSAEAGTESADLSLIRQQ